MLKWSGLLKWHDVRIAYHRNTTKNTQMQEGKILG